MSGGWRFAIGAVGVLSLAVGIIALRALTESRHPPTGPESRTVVEVVARTNLDDPGPDLADLVAAASTTCRLELGADPIGPTAGAIAADRFRTVFSPALDETERERLEGCLEDWSVDHLLLDVVTMRTYVVAP